MLPATQGMKIYVALSRSYHIFNQLLDCESDLSKTEELYVKSVCTEKKKNEFDLLLWALKAWSHAEFIDSVQYADIFCFKSRWSAFPFGEQILRVWWNLKQHVYFIWVIFSSDKDIMINDTRRKFLFKRHTTWDVCFFSLIFEISFQIINFSTFSNKNKLESFPWWPGTRSWLHKFLWFIKCYRSLENFVHRLKFLQ